MVLHDAPTRTERNRATFGSVLGVPLLPALPGEVRGVPAMAQLSAIEWTESTWNPVTGCTKVSPGCLHCYAELMAKRLQAMGQRNYANGFAVTLHPHVLDLPLSWRKPRMVFVNSMSDLFHEAVPDGFIADVFAVMAEASQHTFQVLTKRSERLAEMAADLPWPPNVWMGATIETDVYVHRADHLRQTPAVVKFVSAEPLLGPLPSLRLPGLDWVIAGGESGPGARPMEPDWARELRDWCVTEDVAFFFKQWGGANKKRAGRILDGRTWDEMPALA